MWEHYSLSPRLFPPPVFNYMPGRAPARRKLSPPGLANSQALPYNAMKIGIGSDESLSGDLGTG